MIPFGQNLKARAKELKLTDTAIAKLTGLDARRYNHYATGARTPDLATLVEIAKALKTTPNALLGFRDPSTDPRVASLMAVCSTLKDEQIDILTSFAETLAAKNPS